MRHFAALLLAACTGTIGETGDAPPEPPATDVQLAVRDGNVPQPGVRVLFQSADDRVIAEALTDAAGVARAEMPDGGNVTVIRTYPPPTDPNEPLRAHDVYTYVGVESGDRLELGHRTSEATPSAINVMVPASAAGTVRVVTPCGSGQGTGPIVPLTVRGCASELDVYVMDSADGALFTRAPYGENIDLTGRTLSGQLAATLSATNVPPNTTVTAEAKVMAGAFELYSTGVKRVDNAAATADFPDVQGVEQLVVTASSSASGKQLVAARRPYEVAPVIVDPTVGLIPYVDNLDVSPTGLAWTEQGAGAASFVIATLDVTRAAPQAGVPREYRRALIAPHAGATLRMPMLSGADAIYNPSTSDQIATAHGIGAAPGGYDAVRARAFAVARVVELAPLGATATLSYAGAAPEL